MADCGAVGSALDRSTVGNSNGGSTAIDALSSFLGNVGVSSVPLETRPMILTAPPMSIHEQQHQQYHPALVPAAQQQEEHNPTSVATAEILHTQGNNVRTREMKNDWIEGGTVMNSAPPPNPMMMVHPHHRYRRHHQVPTPPPHLQAQIQMNMQFQQQVIIMQQMQAQQQHIAMQQQRQQQLAAESKSKSNIHEEERLEEAWNHVESSEKGVNKTDDPHETSQEQDDRSWYDHVETQFQSELGRLTAEVDGNEVDAATVDEIAKAWAQGELDEGEWDNPLYPSSTTSPLDVPYQFHCDSATLSLPTDQNNFMAQGQALFRQGKIQSAVLSFEAELQQIHPNNAEAWYMLGLCHAENDLDVQAISCLERAVDRDPYLLEALLALGVSYVNELDHGKALINLKAWVQHNPKYAGMELNDTTQHEEDIYGATTEMEKVQSLLLQALDYYGERNADPDVLEALGVCYNVSRDYDAAVDAFTKAVQTRPDQHQLWNKLGATLANSQRSDEALPAYHEAIKLKPRYARAWLNMAISHSNLQNYDEAARCYLQALLLNPKASHCWSYLRIALTCAEKWDLLPLLAQENIKELSDHFDIVEFDG